MSLNLDDGTRSYIAARRRVQKRLSYKIARKIEQWECWLGYIYAFGADYCYYDIFAQLWGWGKYEYKGNPSKAIQRLKKALKKQRHKDIRKQRPYDGTLQFHVGVAYLCGWLSDKNSEKKAVTWFERSASNGSAQGIMAQGYCFEKGLGDYHIDLDEAEDCYDWAVTMGYSPSYYWKAKLMFEKEPYEPEEVEEWIKKIKELLYEASEPLFWHKSHILGNNPVSRAAQDLLGQVLAWEQKKEQEKIEIISEENEGYEDDVTYEEEYDEDVLWEEDDPRIIPYIEKIEQMDWGFEDIKPTGHWLVEMAMLSYLMDHGSKENWLTYSLRYDEVTEDWVEEALKQLEKKWNASVCKDLDSAEKESQKSYEQDQENLNNLSENSYDWIRSALRKELAAFRKEFGLDEKFDRLSKQGQETLNAVVDTNLAVHKTQEMVVDIRNTVRTIKDFQQTQNQLWISLLEMEELDQKQKGYIQKLQSETKNALKEVAEKDDSILEREEEFLRLIFGSDWRNEARLCNTSCDSLVTARALMCYGSQVRIQNYAGIIITAISALEIETRRRFFDLYIDYLKNDEHRTQDAFPKNLLFHKKKDNDEIYYTLGSFSHIVKVEKMEDGRLDNTVNDFLRKCILSKYAKNIIKSQRNIYTKSNGDVINRKYYPGELFCRYVPAGQKKSIAEIMDDIVNNYRNPAAHSTKGIMSKEDAEACCDILGIKINEDLYVRFEKQESHDQAQKDLNGIEGLLKELLRLTKPLELKKETIN